MTHAFNARLADEPLAIRLAAEQARRDEIADGLQRRHEAEADYASLYAAHHFALALRRGRELGDAVRKL